MDLGSLPTVAKSKTKEYISNIQHNNYIKSRDKRIFNTVRNYYYKVLGRSVVDDVITKLGSNLDLIRQELKRLHRKQKAQDILREMAEETF